MAIELRFFHTGDFENNQSAEYLRNGSRHGVFETVAEARRELETINAYQSSVGTRGQFEYEKRQIVAWHYASVNWGMRYWIVDTNALPPLARDLSQTALDFVA